jgi:C-terminal processing protease CtpA/Prc
VECSLRERAGKYYIIDVSPGGAAARSGAVSSGDVLHAVDGTAVRDLDQV